VNSSSCFFIILLCIVLGDDKLFMTLLQMSCGWFYQSLKPTLGSSGEIGRLIVHGVESRRHGRNDNSGGRGPESLEGVLYLAAMQIKFLSHEHQILHTRIPGSIQDSSGRNSESLSSIPLTLVSCIYNTTCTKKKKGKKKRACLYSTATATTILGCKSSMLAIL